MADNIDLPPVSRNTDPSTSHEAESDINTDGTREQMMVITLRAVREYPGLTANELEEKYHYTNGQLRKRLTDLLKIGLVQKGAKKKCGVSGKNGQTWWPVTE